MFITNATEESIREDGYEEGRAEGLAEGSAKERCANIIKVFSRCIARGMDKDEAVHETAELLDVTEEYVLSVLKEKE